MSVTITAQNLNQNGKLTADLVALLDDIPRLSRAVDLDQLEHLDAFAQDAAAAVGRRELEAEVRRVVYAYAEEPESLGAAPPWKFDEEAPDDTDPQEQPDARQEPLMWMPDRLSQQANAERLVTLLDGKARYNPNAGGWMVYHPPEGRYVVDATGIVNRCAKVVARETWKLVGSAPEGFDNKAAFRHAIDSEKASGVAAMMKLAETQDGIPVTAADFDADHFQLNSLSGVVNLRTGELMPHSPDRLMMKLSPVKYDPNATAPLWESVLNRSMAGNAEMIGYLQRLAGVSLTGDATVQELWIPHGTGANGKSVFFDTLSAAMGDYASGAPDSLLTVKHQSEHPTEIANLCGRRLVIASETEQGAKLRIQLVKRLTGDLMLTGRFMGRDFFTFPRTHKLILISNNKPIIRETSHAIWRRVRLIPFNVKIPDAECDPNMIDKLRAEWPGILAWAVRGCLDWQANGMQTPEAVQVATDKYRRDQDDLGEFVSERCLMGEKMRVPRSELHTAYSDWAKGVGAVDSRTFYEQIRQLDGVEETQIRLHGAQVRVFTGISLATLSNQYQQSQEGLGDGV